MHTNTTNSPTDREPFGTIAQLQAGRDFLAERQLAKGCCFAVNGVAVTWREGTEQEATGCCATAALCAGNGLTTRELNHGQPLADAVEALEDVLDLVFGYDAPSLQYGGWGTIADFNDEDDTDHDDVLQLFDTAIELVKASA